MADIAIEEAGRRKKVKGILSIREIGKRFKETISEIKENIDTAIDNARTRKAERVFESTRDKLVYAGTGYAEKEYLKYAEELEKTKDLTPLERRRHLENVMKGKRKAATAARRATLGALLWNFADGGVKEISKLVAENALAAGVDAAATVVQLSGEGIIAHVLAVFGIVSPPLSTLFSLSISAILLAKALKKFNKSRSFDKSEEILSNKDFMEEFEKLANDVKKLGEELDRTKPEWVAKFKANPRKTKEIKKEYAAYVDGLVDTLGLVNIDRTAIRQVFGTAESTKGTDAPVVQGEKPSVGNEDIVEDEKEEDSSTSPTPTGELTEDQKKQQEEQRRLAEEQRLREEEERRKQEETNAVEEERE